MVPPFIAVPFSNLHSFVNTGKRRSKEGERLKDSKWKRGGRERENVDTWYGMHGVAIGQKAALAMQNQENYKHI